MDEHDADSLNAALLATLRESAPWAAEQVDESVRQGKPVAKQVGRRRGREAIETVAVIRELRRDQFVETTVLSLTERLRITLDAIERLLVDPAPILKEVTRSLKEVGVSEVEFAEPDEDARHELGGLAANISSQHGERIFALLSRLRSNITDVG